MRGTNHGFLTYDGIYPGIGHSGGTTGFNTNLVMIPSHRFGIVTLANSGVGRELDAKILDLLMGNSWDTVVPLAENLPDATSVEGRFVALRRHEGNTMELIDRFFFRIHIQIIAIDENTITFNRGGDVITFRQVEPYVFRAVSVNSPHALVESRNMYELHFIMENGQPVRISTSGFIDFTAETFSQSTLAFLINATLYGFSMLYFLIVPTIVFIRFLRSKEKWGSRFNYLSNGLLLCGALFAINTIALFVRSFAMFEFITTAVATPHVWINYILLALSVVLLVASFVCWKKDAVKVKHRGLYFSNVGILTAFIFVLWQWNYFVMI